LTQSKTQTANENTSLNSVSINALRAACSQCNLRELCLPLELSDAELERIDEMMGTRRRIKRGAHLYSAGEAFTAIYAVRSGFFKTGVIAADGRDQVTGFQMAGDVLGMDGISSEQHTCNAVALEDSEVCTIPFAELALLSSEIRSLQHHIHKVMSREIVRDHGVMLQLGTMRAEERLAGFLLNLSQRFSARGYAANEFHLRMTREEIGSYLGLKLETISRMLSRFHDEGLISVQQKHIQLLDPAGIKQLMTAYR
jgi:CRP/FNR family transcriptional regulator